MAKLTDLANTFTYRCILLNLKTNKAESVNLWKSPIGGEIHLDEPSYEILDKTEFNNTYKILEYTRKHV